MKRFYKLETGSLNLEDLLSSKTILNAYGFNTCIYCGKEVETDWGDEYKVGDYTYDSISPTRCNCELAKEELKAKEQLILSLQNINNKIDIDKINKETYTNLQKVEENRFNDFINDKDNEELEEIELDSRQMYEAIKQLEDENKYWYCEGCACGSFEIYIEDIGYLIIDRECHKSSSVLEGEMFLIHEEIYIYNKSPITYDGLGMMDYKDRLKEGIKEIAILNKEQSKELVEYAKINSKKGLGY